MRSIRHAALASLGLLALAAPIHGEEFVDGIAAQVGADIVLASEVERFAAPVQAKMNAAGAPRSEIVKMRAEILERMIERRLIEQAVRRIEIDATEVEIDTAIAAIANETGLTMDQLRRTVEAKGMTYEAYRDQIRGEIQRQKLISGAIRSRVRVEDKEVLALYEKRYAGQPEGGQEVRLRHILVPFGDGTDATETEACAVAEGARAQVNAGEDFAAVARDTSAVNAQFGGDVGWVHSAALAAWMAEPVSALQAGQMSPVLRTPFGCNVLYLVQRREFEPKTFEDAEPELRHEIFEERMAEEYTAFLEQLREQTYIERKGIYADAAPSFSSSPPSAAGQ
ncbi:MAG: peptidylprolyl isomerase [Deltaproteobacteria bacterium]|nr:peptidylprolyl isomerase [Deltaproteobacteria bacterium]